MATRSGSRGYVPDQGDLVALNFDPRAGHEQAGRRPAVVLSPAGYNGKSGLAVVVPITSQVKGYPFEIVLPPGVSVSGAVLADQLKSVDWRARGCRLIAKLPPDVLREILRKASALIAP